MPEPRCILSKFYIKPQQLLKLLKSMIVVSYRNSTSNHNYTHKSKKIQMVVSYRNSTSNHNQRHGHDQRRGVVSYRNSTSNHNISAGGSSSSSVVSYRNSTSNHNSLLSTRNHAELYLIEILHQTTTLAAAKNADARCILSKFYIKPQHSTA